MRVVPGLANRGEVRRNVARLLMLVSPSSGEERCHGRSVAGSGVRAAGEFAGGFLAELAGVGYRPRSSEAQLYLMRHLSWWLAARGLPARDLTVEVAARFVAARRQVTLKLSSSRRLARCWATCGDGVCADAGGRGSVAPAEVAAERFARYLSAERGLAPATLASYLSQVRPFLVAHATSGGGWKSLTARQVAAFVTGRAAGQRPRSVAVGANALRSLLRWMWRRGCVSAPMAGAVGPVAARTGTDVRRALDAAQLAGVLAALPADGPVRLRDEAMLALMWRLGLRAGEAASLRLEDIDWRAGLIVVRGKGSRCEPMPLPADVGALIVAYLRQGGPRIGPPGGVPGPGRAAPAAGRERGDQRRRPGSHPACVGPRRRSPVPALRRMRCWPGGGGLADAGQLLRHATAAATAVYAKSDLAALAVLARRWPIGAGR